jgi:hypothetical protein
MVHTYETGRRYPTHGHNYYHFIDVGAEHTIVYMAHHDIVNPKIDNCNDNTASVCHLMALHRKLVLRKDKLKYNVLIAFVDFEERCDHQIAGSTHLARKINEGEFGPVALVLNLELTAYGEEIWFSTFGDVQSDDIERLMEFGAGHRVRVPLNDALHFGKENIPAFCIGTFNKTAVKEYHDTGYCTLWATCHRSSDNFDEWAVKSHMASFNNTLVKIAVDF